MILRKIKCILWHIYLISEFFLVSAVIRIFSADPVLRRKRLLKNNTRISKRFIRAFNIKLTLNNSENLQKLQDIPYLAVSNHTTYLDIILLSAVEKFVFITSVEMRKNPFLGRITKSGGCLYTNRKKYISLPTEIEKFASAIHQGFKVVLFPEGTSTNGITVQPFRRSLFQVAIEAKCPILPVCIKYKAIDGKKIDKKNRDLIYWYGDMPFLIHYLKIIGHSLEAQIDILTIIPYQEGKTRQELANQVYGQILSSYLEQESSVDKQSNSLSMVLK